MQTTATHLGSAAQSNLTGTLLWIGDRDGRQFADAYRTCEQSVSQMAWRCDVNDALRRPATDVQGVLVAQSNRLPMTTAQYSRLSEAYPSAARLNLLGSMCSGVCRMPLEFFGKQRHYWHRSNQVLPEFLSRWSVGESVDRKPANSVAVIAANYASATSLLDLAQSSGVTAAWSRVLDPISICNVDAVWWDDSIARPANRHVWLNRIARMNSSTRRVRHAWIANTPRAVDVQEAQHGGIELVISKPYRIDPLLEMLAAVSLGNASMSVSRLRVA